MIEVTQVGDEAELELWLDLRNSVAAHEPVSAELIRFRRARHPTRADLLARLDGAPAGFGTAHERPDRKTSPYLSAFVGVLPEFRRRGAGSALHLALSEHARRLGKSGLEIEVWEDEPDGIAFLARRGYAEVERYSGVALDLTAHDPLPVDPPPGVELVSRAERPELVEGMFEVAAEAIPDVPGAQASVVEREGWLAYEVERPGVSPELTLIALAGGQVVGYASLAIISPGAGAHLMTAVRRAWRGRGVAGALKRAQIRAAREAGLLRLETMNEERNEPIRRVNARLGYRPMPAFVVYHGPLA